VIASQLSHAFGSVVGLDLAMDGSTQVWREQTRAGLAFVGGDGTQLPFPSAAFDVVVCAQVYEHVQAQHALAAEIYRVLCPGGVCFFSGPNKYALVDEHYWLPFLSWLPATLADRYVWLVRGKERYDVWPSSYSRLRALWKDFEIHDYTMHILRAPEKHGVSRWKAVMWLTRRLPDSVLRLLLPLVPNYNWILVKR
jgi:SAM-dependent methyltransferase